MWSYGYWSLWFSSSNSMPHPTLFLNCILYTLHLNPAFAFLSQFSLHTRLFILQFPFCSTLFILYYIIMIYHGTLYFFLCTMHTFQFINLFIFYIFTCSILLAVQSYCFFYKAPSNLVFLFYSIYIYISVLFCFPLSTSISMLQFIIFFLYTSFDKPRDYWALCYD